MILDSQLVFTYTSASVPEKQTITGATNVASANVLDAGAGQSYANGVDGSAPAPNLGLGPQLYLITKIETAGTGTGASLNVKLVGGATWDGTTFNGGNSRVLAQSGAIATALIPADTLIVLPVAPMPGFRFYRVEFGLNNADNSFVVKSFLSLSVPAPYKMIGPAYLA